jgi:hypothetical protein
MNVLIGGYIKSGTTLLAKLLDNAPDIVVFPEELGLPSVFRDTNNHGATRKWNQIKDDDRFLRLSQGIQSDWTFGNRDYSSFNFNEFIKSVDDQVSDDISDFELLEIILRSYATVDNLKGEILIEKTPGNETLFSRFLDCNSSNKVLYISRNPKDVFCAVKKKRAKQNIAFNADNFIFSWVYGNTYVRKMQNIYGTDRVFILTYEELVQATEETMRNVSLFLGINFSSSMLQPTSRGTIWEGNSMRDVKYSQVKWIEPDRSLLQVHEEELINDGISIYKRNFASINWFKKSFLKIKLSLIPFHILWYRKI